MMKKTILLLVIVALAGLLMFYGAPTALDAQYKSSSDDGFPRILNAERVVVLHAEINGMIREITARPQEFVAQGDPLIAFDRELVELQLERITTQIELDTGVEEAAINVDFSRDALKIVKQLHEEQIGKSRAASPKELKEATQRRDVAELGDKKANRDMEMLRNDRNQSEMILKRHTIGAPMNGVVVPIDSVVEYQNKDVKQPEVGEMVLAGSAVTAMMKVDRLQVYTTLGADLLDRVTLGQKANVYVQGFDEAAFPAKIIYISPTINLNDFRIIVELENPEIDWQGLPKGTYRYKFRPGMGARIEIVYTD